MRAVVILSTENWERDSGRAKRLAQALATLGCKTTYVETEWRSLQPSRRPADEEWPGFLANVLQQTSRSDSGITVLSAFLQATYDAEAPTDLAQLWLKALVETQGAGRPVFWAMGDKWEVLAPLLAEYGVLVYDALAETEREGQLVAAAAFAVGRSSQTVGRLLAKGKPTHFLLDGTITAAENTWVSRAEEALTLIEHYESAPPPATPRPAGAPTPPTPPTPPARTFHGLYIGNNRMLITPRWGGQLLVPADDRSLMPTLVTSGLLEPELTQFLLRQLKPGMTFVDVGANLGYFTVLAAHLVGQTGRVIAYEANPAVFDLLRENLTLNYAHDRCTLRNLAVYSKEGELTFHRSRQFIGNSSIHEPDSRYFEAYQGDQMEAIRVSAESLDTGLADLDRIDFLKIDIEGGEYHAFLGMRQLLKQGKIGTVSFELNATFGNDLPAFGALLSEIQAETGKRLWRLGPSGQPEPVALEQLLAWNGYPHAILQ